MRKMVFVIVLSCLVVFGITAQQRTMANMVRINGGTFTMGSPASEPERNDDEGPQHQVTVSSFFIGKYEVTQKEFQEVMGNTSSRFPGDNLPVDHVSWYQALLYCNRLSEREGLTPAYNFYEHRDEAFVSWNRKANGYRLPTEAEWEYACRAGTTTPFNTGNTLYSNQANYNGTEPYNNTTGNYLWQTTPARIFPPNAWGLYDMHGNVWEWCWDEYEAYSSGAQTDPVVSHHNDSIDQHIGVLRGGSWYNGARDARSAHRRYTDGNSYSLLSASAVFGFRLVRNAQ